MPINLRILLLFLLALSAGCAKRGTISGGTKDTIPPVLQQAIPANFSTGFKGNEIRLFFDEYVKLKDVDKQLIISPPMNTAPIISPTTASRVIKITLKDTLLPNTTYSLNFGQSIADNNESNPYRQFKYVFSTGSHIDSLTLSGFVRDAFNPEPDPFVTVMLYEADETYTDSAVYKVNPRYVTNTLDSARTFHFENLREGRYKLLALKDNVANYRFDPKSDKIAFQEAFVTVPGDTLYELEMFREEVAFRALKPSLGTGNKLLMPIEGKPDSTAVTLKSGNEMLPSVITKVPQKDSMMIWFRPIKADSLNVRVAQGRFAQEFNVRIKAQKQDTLSFTQKHSATLPLRSPFVLKSSRPLVKVDESLIQVRDRDSAAVPFASIYDALNMELTLDFKREPLAVYNVDLLPGAVTDFYDKQNDSLSYRISTKNTSDYGNLRLTLENVRTYPIIVELANPRGETMAATYVTGPGQISFESLDPSLYTVRVIYDENGNKKWDTGNFLQRKQAEEVVYFPTPIDVRANWDVDQPVRLP